MGTFGLVLMLVFNSNIIVIKITNLSIHLKANFKIILTIYKRTIKSKVLSKIFYGTSRMFPNTKIFMYFKTLRFLYKDVFVSGLVFK